MNNYLIEASDHLLVQNKINEIININKGDSA